MRTRSATTCVLAMLTLIALGSGCGAIFRLTSNSGEAISFTNGELRSREPYALVELDAACERAIEAVGYEDASAERREDQIVWRARSAGGDGVEIRLTPLGPTQSEVVIRVGVLGDETRSRLLLEQIHQSL